MKKNDKFIGDILEPFEKALGMKFNKFQEPVDPKFVAPKKRNLKRELVIAERKQEKSKKNPKKYHWDKAMQKAKNVKIKDDPKIIKKVIKNKEDKKKRSQKKWAERLSKQKKK